MISVADNVEYLGICQPRNHTKKLGKTMKKTRKTLFSENRYRQENKGIQKGFREDGYQQHSAERSGVRKSFGVQSPWRGAVSKEKYHGCSWQLQQERRLQLGDSSLGKRSRRGVWPPVPGRSDCKTFSLASTCYFVSIFPRFFENGISFFFPLHEDQR